MACSPLATPSATRAVLEEFGLATKRRLGQNFLVSDAVIGRILGLAELSPEDVVLEVGPGIGTLTCAMLPRAGAVVAIEADHDLPPVLAATCAGVAGDGGAAGGRRMALIEGDALRVGTSELAAALWDLPAAQGPDGVRMPNKLVSNLPYQVAATLVLRCMDEMPSLERAVVMVQAEVADRMAARPGTKTYGAYTAKLALVGAISGRFEVGPANFMPPPHVGSAVVRIERRLMADPATGEPLDDAALARVRQVIDAAFAQRRKTIRNSMTSSGFDAATLLEALSACGIDARARAESLSPADFVRLAAALGRAGWQGGMRDGR